MIPISLDALPRFSPWPAWLLGDESVPRPTIPSYEQRYADLLAFCQGEERNLRDVLRAFLGDPERRVAMSLDENLYETTTETAVGISNARIAAEVERVAKEVEARSVVDLGCGWGSLLSALPRSLSLYGTEASPSGEVVARLLCREYAQIYRHDLASQDLCLALAAAPAPVVATTSFVCHYLPSARYAIEHIAQWREKVAAVVTFEPEADDFGFGLLALLRRSYVRARGYSADAKAVLRARDDVQILETTRCAVGANALLPGSLTTWRFK